MYLHSPLKGYLIYPGLGPLVSAKERRCVVLVFGTSRGSSKLLLEKARDLGEKTKGTTWHMNIYAFCVFQILKYYIYIDMYSIRYGLLDVDLTQAWITSLAKVVFGI